MTLWATLAWNAWKTSSVIFIDIKVKWKMSIKKRLIILKSLKMWRLSVKKAGLVLSHKTTKCKQELDLQYLGKAHQCIPNFVPVYDWSMGRSRGERGGWCWRWKRLKQWTAIWTLKRQSNIDWRSWRGSRWSRSWSHYWWRIKKGRLHKVSSTIVVARISIFKRWHHRIGQIRKRTSNRNSWNNRSATWNMGRKGQWCERVLAC